MADTTLSTLTDGMISGAGVFDKLMAATKAHLDLEFKAGRIKGPEYSQVYLGQVQTVLQTAVQFLSIQQKIDLEAKLLQEQINNAVLEGKVLIAQECKLKAEYDLTLKTTEKVGAEIALLTQKMQTEKAQTVSMGVDEDSVIGKQKKLYQAQTEGFKRDAEQKAAGIMVDSWKARRMTDEATVADGVNQLNDATVGQFVLALKNGIGA